MKKISGVLHGLTEVTEQKIELSSELKIFFSKSLEILSDEKIASAENEIEITVDLKQVSESLQKGEGLNDLKFFYGVEDSDFSNRLDMQG